ncbi:unnamed protein product [Peronospora belbahrii]|uniref:Uncharacterized protein n=1 Tax=Peronospora belbahrii TaxID=622444 RepID=A0AAU9L345_9STRA|nr:unnamed protein product [Peronospora belbahrii]
MAISAFITTLVCNPHTANAKRIVMAEPGTELFTQFRPVYHFLAPEKWMNDPCAPYYDEDTGLYHMFYQWNPSSTIWGNMTWGHGVSKDQVTWEDYPTALYPFKDKWDKLGVYSGFAMDNAIDGKQTIFYTGVTAQPIFWKNKYLYGEHVLYATTKNGGKTWKKGKEPLIKAPPKDLDVTGWRDPMPFHSKLLDAYFGYDTIVTSNYLIVTGGVRDVGPRVFLYHAEDYINWEYKGYLLAQEKNTSFSRYSGNWGFNFETTIYREMVDEDGERHNVMLLGAEGEVDRYSMWATGSICDSEDEAQTNPETGLFTPLMVGVSDRSDWYANSIYTNRDGKDVLIGWITEDNGFTKGQPQGWSGILSLPREVGISIFRNIYDAGKHLVGKGDWIVSEITDVSCANGSSKQSKTIKTLGLKPLSDLKLLRNEDTLEEIEHVCVNSSSKVLASRGASFELMAEVSDFKRGSKVGFEVRRSSAGDEVTTIVYDDAKKKVIIDRSKSSSADCAVFVDNDVTPVSDSIWGHFYLYDVFTSAAKNCPCEVVREKLSFHVFVDVSSVEVFVNGRFALSARIYPCASQTQSDGIALTTSEKATFQNVKVWTKPKHAWASTRKVPKKV